MLPGDLNLYATPQHERELMYISELLLRWYRNTAEHEREQMCYLLTSLLRLSAVPPAASPRQASAASPHRAVAAPKPQHHKCAVVQARAEAKSRCNV